MTIPFVIHSELEHHGDGSSRAIINNPAYLQTFISAIVSCAS